MYCNDECYSGLHLNTHHSLSLTRNFFVIFEQTNIEHRRVKVESSTFFSPKLAFHLHCTISESRGRCMGKTTVAFVRLLWETERSVGLRAPLGTKCFDPRIRRSYLWHSPESELHLHTKAATKLLKI